ncbi:MAG TPA: cysteine--tRNA ligase [Candidatus Limnocylindrales bacterium]|nr:cysteine--tRNA ligase [Candidatus Limnocylindrales bacterium]
MTLRLRNTLGRVVEPIEPIDGHRVRMYTCGPTVYRYAHVGNLRSYLLADLIRRTLLYHGLDVLHVKNVTDVGHLRDERFDRGEDRMLVAAGLEERTPAEIAAAYEAAFHADEAALNILPAHVFPRATEHVSEMIDLAERLVDGGHAYVSPERNVYFAVASLPGYGRLSGNSVDELRAGHRSEPDPDKRDAADFALWKAAGEGRILRWPTARWGEGFPGWHLECSAMSLRYLGEEFDVHTGGIDNVFPHHEDEIAQSTAATGHVPARHWVHGEHLLMAGRKMAKSAGNFVRITDLAEGVDPLAFRYLLLTARYGRKLNLSPDSFAAAAAALESLRSALRALPAPPGEGPFAVRSLRAGAAPDRPDGVAAGIAGHGDRNAGYELRDRAHAPAAPLSPAGRELHDAFVAAIDDDLDTPTALAVVRRTLRADAAPEERRWLVLDADAVLGLGLDRVWDAAPDEGPDIPVEVRRLAGLRADARRRRDFASADALRDEIADAGWEVEDRAEGPVLRPRPRA